MKGCVLFREREFHSPAHLNQRSGRSPETEGRDESAQ
jgi:hypothetical protein